MIWKIWWKKNIKENSRENVMIFSQLFSLKKYWEKKKKKRRERKREILSGSWYSNLCLVFKSCWSSRFWGQTWCNFEGSGLGSCVTGDCGSGTIKCNNVDATLPTTLAEFTLGTNGQDFYDVSLIDGCNLSMIVEGSGWLGMCASTSCTVDLN